LLLIRVDSAIHATPAASCSDFLGLVYLTVLKAVFLETAIVHRRCVKLNMAVAAFQTRPRAQAEHVESLAVPLYKSTLVFSLKHFLVFPFRHN
jgi:hypothetical protein